MKPKLVTSIPKDHFKAKLNSDKPKDTFLKDMFKCVIFVLLAVTVISSFVSYTLVLSKENDILKLHKKASVTQMENNDIKTEVEFAKSLYNVQDKASGLSFLSKPDKIIEVDITNKTYNVELDDVDNLTVERFVSGY